MATICLNFSYDQMKERSPTKNQLQLYRYGFLGFNSDYKPGFRIKKEIANRGKTITVRNYTVQQLFAIAYGAGTPINHEQVIIDVMNPEKLQQIRCYKLFVPQQQIDNFYTIIQQNLHMEFGDYKITIDYRGKENYMIIKDTDD